MFYTVAMPKSRWRSDTAKRLLAIVAYIGSVDETELMRPAV